MSAKIAEVEANYQAQLNDINVEIALLEEKYQDKLASIKRMYNLKETNPIDQQIAKLSEELVGWTPPELTMKSIKEADKFASMSEKDFQKRMRKIEKKASKISDREVMDEFLALQRESGSTSISELDASLRSVSAFGTELTKSKTPLSRPPRHPLEDSSSDEAIFSTILSGTPSIAADLKRSSTSSMSSASASSVSLSPPNPTPLPSSGKKKGRGSPIAS